MVRLTVSPPPPFLKWILTRKVIVKCVLSIIESYSIEKRVKFSHLLTVSLIVKYPLFLWLPLALWWMMEFLVFVFIFPFIKTKPPKNSEFMVGRKAFVVRCRRFWFRQLQSEKAAWQDQGSVKGSGEAEARCERDGNSRNLLNIAAGGGFPRIQYCHRNLLELTQQKTYFGTFTIWTNMYRQVKK